MRAAVGFLLACVAVASLVAIASGQTYTLEPSGTVVDWHVATEWEYLMSPPLVAPGMSGGDTSANCQWDAGGVEVIVDEDLTVSTLTIVPLGTTSNMTMSGGITFTFGASFVAAGVNTVDVFVVGTGTETLASNVMTLGPQVYVSNVIIADTLIGTLTTVDEVALTDVTLEISEVAATGPLALGGHTVARGASFGTDGQPGSTITIPQGALLSVESSPFTFEDHLNVSGTVENVAPGGTMTFSGDGEFAFDDTAVLAAGPSNDIQLDAGAVIECAGCTVEMTDAAITGTAPSALRVSVAPALINGSGSFDANVPIELDGADLDIAMSAPAGTGSINSDVTLGDGTTLGLSSTDPMSNVTLNAGTFTAGAGSTISVDDVEVVIGDFYTAVVPNLAMNDGGELTVDGVLAVADSANLGDGPITVGAGGELSLPAMTAFTGLGATPVTVEGTGNLITDGWTGNADVTVESGGTLTASNGTNVTMSGLLSLAPGATVVAVTPLLTVDNSGTAVALDGATISGSGTVAFPNGGFTTVDAPQTTITVPTVVSNGLSAVENLAAASTTIEVAGGSLEFGGIGSSVGSVVVDAPATLSLSTVDAGFTPTDIVGLLDLSAVGASVEVVMSSDGVMPITVATYGSVAGAPTVTVIDTGVSAADFDCTPVFGATSVVVDCVPVTTAAPSTAAPTSAPTTAPTTAAPTMAPTSAPTTAPTTSAPTTAAPTTAAPTTAAPTTAAPTTAPTTAAPTMAPTSASTTAPTTAAPTTAPTTAAPTTAAPTTAAPTAPTTSAPTTAPTTAAPTTAPTTAAPTTAPSTTAPTSGPTTAAPTTAPTSGPTTAPSTTAPTTAPTTTGNPITAGPADNTGTTNPPAFTDTVASRLQKLFGTETPGAAWGIALGILGAVIGLVVLLCLVICCCCCGGCWCGERRTKEGTRINVKPIKSLSSSSFPSQSSGFNSATFSTFSSSQSSSLSSSSSLSGVVVTGTARSMRLSGRAGVSPGMIGRTGLSVGMSRTRRKSLTTRMARRASVDRPAVGMSRPRRNSLTTRMARRASVDRPAVGMSRARRNSLTTRMARRASVDRAAAAAAAGRSGRASTSERPARRAVSSERTPGRAIASERTYSRRAAGSRPAARPSGHASADRRRPPVSLPMRTGVYDYPSPTAIAIPAQVQVGGRNLVRMVEESSSSDSASF